MNRALACLVIASWTLSACDEPCRPGYAKAGYDCKKLPLPDGGLDGGKGDAASETNGDGAVSAGMDGGVCLPPACDPCEANPCANGGACETIATGFKCACAIGFTGARCQIDPCELDPCLHGGACKRNATGRVCDCSADWVGDACETNTNAKLANIVPSAGTLYPAFSPSTFEYSLDLGVGDPDVTFKLIPIQPDGVALFVGDESVAAEVPSQALPLTLNLSPASQVSIRSSADSGDNVTYSVTVRRTLVQQAYVKRPEAVAVPNFGGESAGSQEGQMLTLRGDTLAIADSHYDGDRGAVHLLSRNAGFWSFTRFFTTDVPGARFGAAVLLTDDLLVIGA